MGNSLHLFLLVLIKLRILFFNHPIVLALLKTNQDLSSAACVFTKPVSYSKIHTL